MKNQGMMETRLGKIYENGSFHEKQRTVARENCFEIYVNQKAVGRLVCSPAELREAALGYLRIHDVIDSSEDVRTLEICEETGRILASVQRKPSEKLPQKTVLLRAEEVFALASRLEGLRQRGVHSCALVQDGNFLCCHDVSRGAAVDKAAGTCLERKISTEQSVMIFSGRVASSILVKAEKLGCSVIVARSGPTDLACQMAEQAGITLIGLAGEGRFCIYTCPERIEI